MQASGFLASPNFSTASRGSTHMTVEARICGSQANGSVVVNRTVYLSGASTFSTFSSSPRWGFPLTVKKRSKLHLTSSAVSSRPFMGGLLCQRTPLRRLKTQEVSLVRDQDSARSPSSGVVPGTTDEPAFTLRSRLWVNDRFTIVLNVKMSWGSKPIGSSPRIRNTPPRLGVCASAAFGRAACSAPAAAAPPPSFSRSRRVSSMSILLSLPGDRKRLESAQHRGLPPLELVGSDGEARRPPQQGAE